LETNKTSLHQTQGDSLFESVVRRYIPKPAYGGSPAGEI
jgi:hypothetical protein